MVYEFPIDVKGSLKYLGYWVKKVVSIDFDL